MILSKITFLSNVSPISTTLQQKVESIIFKHIWQFHKTEPITRKTLFLPKHQGGIGLIHPQYHSLAMRLKHFLKLKEKTNHKNWIILTRYNLASILYRLNKNFKYMISNNTIKTEKPDINFYYEDIITYLKKQNAILELPKNSRKIYKKIIQNEHKHYIKIGQSYWNKYSPQTPWNELWKNTFYSYNWPENNNILYLLLHFVTRTNDQIHSWTNQKYLKSLNCKLCDKAENITHLYIECKRNKKISKYFQKYYQTLTQKQNTPLPHILTISSLSLPPKTKKLTLTLTTTILTHI